MDKILVLSQPIFEQKPFFVYAQKLFKPGSRVFIVNSFGDSAHRTERVGRELEIRGGAALLHQGGADTTLPLWSLQK